MLYEKSNVIKQLYTMNMITRLRRSITKRVKEGLNTDTASPVIPIKDRHTVGLTVR